MPSLGDFFRQLFLICAASFLCEILTENTHIVLERYPSGFENGLRVMCLRDIFFDFRRFRQLGSEPFFRL